MMSHESEASSLNESARRRCAVPVSDRLRAVKGSSLIRVRDSRRASNLVSKPLMLKIVSGPEWTTLEP